MVYGTLSFAIAGYIYLGYGKWIDTSVESLFHWRTSAVDSAREYRGVPSSRPDQP